MTAPTLTTVKQQIKKGEAIPVGGGDPVQAKALVGTAVRCPDCSTDGRQVAAEIVDGGWACWSCGSAGTAEQMLGKSGCVLRSGDGRPWIIGTDGKVRQYRRASSAAEPMEDAFAFHKRDLRAAVLGILRNPLLALQVEVAVPAGALIDDLEQQHRVALDEVVEEAMRTGGAWLKADLGTLLHRVGECRDQGLSEPDYPPHCDVTLKARQLVLEKYDFIWLARERFVVNDEDQIAGSFDGVAIITLPDHPSVPKHLRGKRVIVVVDDKYGRHMDLGGLSHTTQQSVYNGGDLYDPATGRRVPLMSLIPEGETAVWTSEVSVILNQPAGGNESHLIVVPLENGRAAVAMSQDLLAMRNDAKRWLLPADTCVVEVAPVAASASIPNVSTPVNRISDEIAATTTIEDLLALREREQQPVDYGNGRVLVPWTSDHEDLAAARAALLKQSAPDHEGEVLRRIGETDCMENLEALWRDLSDFWTPACDEAAAARARVLKGIDPPF